MFVTPKFCIGIIFSHSWGHFNSRLQNSPYFCVFKYARAVKQKVWNEAYTPYESVRLAHFAHVRLLRHALSISLPILREKTDCFAVYFNSQEKLKTKFWGDKQKALSDSYGIFCRVDWTLDLCGTRAPCYQSLTTPENTVTHHNVFCLSPQNFA